MSRAEKDVYSYVSNHTCVSFISVAGIKHPDKKQFREKGIYLSLEFQAVVGWVIVGTSNSRSHHICRQKQLSDYTHTYSLACAQLGFSVLIQFRTPLLRE